MRIITNDKGELQITLQGVIVEDEEGDYIECDSIPLLRRGDEMIASSFCLVVPLPEEGVDDVIVEVVDHNDETLFTIPAVVKRNPETGNETIVFNLAIGFTDDCVVLVPVPFEPDDDEEIESDRPATVPIFLKPSGIPKREREEAVRRCVGRRFTPGGRR